ncbi:MAG: DUF3306 domain-containing protein [Gammaproteobacteria bacterium]|nr:DUF3306 domain-containing protein [Gammaproteobacteria bacterium]
MMKTTKADENDGLFDDDNEGGGVMSSWAKRKRAVLQEQKAYENDAAGKNEEEEDLLTDVDMPPIESLTADSDYTGFMSPKVSDALRRLALRKLFHGAEFNICDGLDDYDGDYTSFAKLGNIVTADMKHQIEMEARNKARLLEEQKAEELLAQESAIEQDTDKEQSVLEGDISNDTEFEDDAALIDVSNAPDANDSNELGGDRLMLPKVAAVNAESITKVKTNETEDDAFDDEDDLDGGMPG